MFIILGKIGCDKYNELSNEYDAIQYLLEKPMLVIETCECGNVVEKIVKSEPLCYDKITESLQFTIYEVKYNHCSKCYEQKKLAN